MKKTVRIAGEDWEMSNPILKLNVYTLKYQFSPIYSVTVVTTPEGIMVEIENMDGESETIIRIKRNELIDDDGNIVDSINKIVSDSDDLRIDEMFKDLKST